MKIAGSDYHLTYCTNIHPGESWLEVRANLARYIPQLKNRLAPHGSFGIGLRLSNLAAQELLQQNNLAQFQAWLQAEDLYVFTLNGFPYGGFHDRVVKDQVYAPDWSTRERLNYTLRLIDILTVLLPEKVEGSISTVPLSYKPWWRDRFEGKQYTYQQSSLHLAQVVANLARVYQNTGKLLHLDLEPEPDGMVENTAEAIEFFQDWLLPVAGNWLQQELGISQSQAETWIRDYIRICYDTCHFALEYEEPRDIIQGFQDAGLKIGKIQLSSAIKIQIPESIAQRHLLVQQLTPFAESTYLHQVIARQGDRSLKRYRDLAIALPELAATTAQEWRTHFHVPIFIDRYQLFESTQEHLEKLLQLLPSETSSHHLEIETYTWEVLPPPMKLDILTSIEREYRWILDHFS